VKAIPGVSGKPRRLEIPRQSVSARNLCKTENSRDFLGWNQAGLSLSVSPNESGDTNLTPLVLERKL
jgi:hypothetical protein